MNQTSLSNSTSLALPDDERSFISRYWKLALIVLLAGLLRFNHFRQPFVDAFSWRESSTAMMAWNFFHESSNIFFPAVNWAGPDPAYTGREFQTVTWIAAIFYRVFGPQEWIGRSICAAAGVWSVIAIFGLVRRAWDERRAHAAAFMLAIIPGVVFIDRSFLPDPLMLALTLTTVWAYIAFLQNARDRYPVVAGIIGVVAILTKLPGIVTLAPMAYATVAILRKQGRFNLATVRPILAVLLIALVPIGAYYFWAWYLGTHYPPYHVAGGGNWLNAKRLITWPRDGYFLRKAVGIFGDWMWSLPVAVLALIGLLFSPRRIPSKSQPSHAPVADAPYLFHFWAIGCTILYLIGAQELVSNPWNFHIFNPIGAALAGQGLILLVVGGIAWRDGAPLRIAPVAAAVRLAIIASVVLWQSHLKTEMMTKSFAYNSMMLGEALQRYSKPNETVVTIADDVGDPIAIYYSHRRGWVFPPAHHQRVWPAWNRFPTDESLTIKMFEELRSEGADWLGIVINPRDDNTGRREFWQNHPKFVDHINTTCQFIEKTPNCVIYRILTQEQLAARKAMPTTQPVRP